MKWSVIKKELRYKGFFQLTEISLQHDLFAGGQSPVLRRELIDRGHAVVVLPYDPVRDEVILIEQFIHFQWGPNCGRIDVVRRMI